MALSSVGVGVSVFLADFVPDLPKNYNLLFYLTLVRQKPDTGIPGI
jgi:hypothetical protein